MPGTYIFIDFVRCKARASIVDCSSKRVSFPSIIFCTAVLHYHYYCY